MARESQIVLARRQWPTVSLLSLPFPRWSQVPDWWQQKLSLVVQVGSEPPELTLATDELGSSTLLDPPSESEGDEFRFVGSKLSEG